MYASFCEGLNAECAENSFVPSGVGHTILRIDNNYTRGMVSIASAFDNAESLPAAAVTKSESGLKTAVSFQSCAIDGNFKEGTSGQNEDADSNVLHLTMNPVADPPEFFGVDTTCQKNNVGIAIAGSSDSSITQTIKALDVTSLAAVKISGSDALEFGTVAVKCDNSATEMKNLRVHHVDAGGSDRNDKAVQVKTLLGEVKMTGESCVFDPAKKGGDGSLYVHAVQSNIGCSNKIKCTYSSTLYPLPSVSALLYHSG